MAFATEEWAAEAAELWPLLPPAGDVTGTVSLAVAVAPRREVAFHWRYEGGVTVGGGVGTGGGAGSPDGPANPSVAFTLATADAEEVFSGAVVPSVAFMRGRLKATGDGELLIAFLESSQDAGFSDWLARLAGGSGLSESAGGSGAATGTGQA